MNQRHALGAVLGALVGDAAGAVLEFLGKPIEEADVEHALTMPGGGTWGVARGQVTDDGELTMSVLHALAAAPDRPTEAAAERYAHWVATDPFDIGATTNASLGCLTDPALAARAEREGAAAVMTATARERCMRSKANGSLMRATPLAVWGARRSRADAAETAARDARLSHPNPACVDAAQAYVVAIRRLILEPGNVDGAFADAREVVTDEEVAGWLRDAEDGIAVEYAPSIGFVRIGFTHAFRHLLLATPYEAALRETLLGGGDTDTNACIVGGLLGARWGLDAVPPDLVRAVVECDPSTASNPRPEELHPRDAAALVSAVLAVA